MSPSGLYSENQVPESCVDSLVHLAPHFCLTIMIVVFNHSFQLLQSAFNTIFFRPIFIFGLAGSGMRSCAPNKAIDARSGVDDCYDLWRLREIQELQARHREYQKICILGRRFSVSGTSPSGTTNTTSGGLSTWGSILRFAPFMRSANAVRVLHQSLMSVCVRLKIRCSQPRVSQITLRYA